MSNLLEVQQLCVAYGNNTVVHDVSLSLASGEIGCLLGPSGCGKTTLLRAIAGFEPVKQGKILLGGKSVSSPGFTTPPEKRQIGMVFQDFALFPHLTIADNIGFGIRHLKGSHRKQRIDELLLLSAFLISTHATRMNSPADSNSVSPSPAPSPPNLNCC